MSAPNGRLIFFFNHSDLAATVEFKRLLEKPAIAVNEISTSQRITTTGTQLEIKTEVPAESVRIYRIDY
jgi:hypothetical protein